MDIPLPELRNDFGTKQVCSFDKNGGPDFVKTRLCVFYRQLSEQRYSSNLEVRLNVQSGRDSKN